MRFRIAAFLLAAVCTIPPLSAADLVVSADNYVKNATGGIADGTSPDLTIKDNFSALLKFDLTPYQALNLTTSEITSATLTFFVSSVNRLPASVNIALAGQDWSEMPADGFNFSLVSPVFATASIPGSLQFVTVDVTQQVRSWLTAGLPNNGFILSASGPGLNINIDSKENTLTSHPAYLNIVLMNTGSTGSIGPTGATGPTGAIGPQGMAGPQGPTTTGPTGPMGATGATGAQGPSGAQGPTGSTGLAGSTGPAGLAGALGSTGPAGQRGGIGAIGPTGPQGAAGPVGAAGPTGAPNPPYGNNWSFGLPTDVATNQRATTTMQCPQGQFALSGACGRNVNDADTVNFIVINSAPTTDGKWQCAVQNNASHSVSFIAGVFCIDSATSAALGIAAPNLETRGASPSGAAPLPVHPTIVRSAGGTR